MKKRISAVILAGGKGERFKSSLPKQFLPLKGKPVINYSIDLFSEIEEIEEIIVVAHEEFIPLIQRPSVHFAKPGLRRQDSLFNALSHVRSPWVLIHDAARPLLTKEMVSRLLNEQEAATLALPLPFTVKEVCPSGFILKTLSREFLREIQTPQLIPKDLLIKGFEVAHRKHLTVTDDVGLVELLGLPVKIVEGSLRNIKITKREDLLWAEYVLSNDEVEVSSTV